MSNHTINSWKKFCLYHKEVVEDLRKRAIGNAERRTVTEDMDTTGTGASEVTGAGASEETGTVAGEAIGTVAGDTTKTGAAGDALPTPQQTNPHENQPPPPPYQKVAGPGPVLVKTEPSDEDQLDFAFAADVLASWNANEESDAALWKRMESMVHSLVFSSGLRDANTRPQRPCSSAPSWDVFCERHRSRFEHFFATRSTWT